jgi:hypothetical protein
VPVSALQRLRDWEDAGAGWRVLHVSDDHAVVQLCACTGEPVDRLESDEPDLIALLRARSSSED